MKDFENRLLEEYEQLGDRYEKLNNFIYRLGGFEKLSYEDQTDLVLQSQHMKGYRDALMRRIKRLEILS